MTTEVRRPFCVDVLWGIVSSWGTVHRSRDLKLQQSIEKHPIVSCLYCIGEASIETSSNYHRNTKLCEF